MDSEWVTLMFDSIAGATFGAFGVSRFGTEGAGSCKEDHSDLNQPLFAWIMVAEAMARHEDSSLAWFWLKDQLRLASCHDTTVFALQQAQIQDCWTNIVPILLFSGARRRDFAESFARTFDVSKYTAIHTLLLALWERYGVNLFQPGDWNAEVKHAERYSTPDRACIVKLGLTLKFLAEQTNGDERMRWEHWQQRLKHGVLHRLPERITRGFAPDKPLLEDIVLALLAVAEWLTFEQGWRIRTFVDDIDKRDAERLSPEQKLLAGALYGWQRGYRGVGNMVPGLQQRAALSRQSFCIAAQAARSGSLAPEIVASIVQSNTASGTLSAFLSPYLGSDLYQRNDGLVHDPAGRAQSNGFAGQFEVTVAQQTFLFHLNAAESPRQALTGCDVIP